MPEYLAPGVYVEEIDSGPKPIEGVSTSTAGMLGVTERGPADVPILVTSFGEYTRWFGGMLDRRDFGDHCYVPHAVEGFFTNGGKRLYVTRVLDREQARRAALTLFDRGSAAGAAGAATALLRSAAERSGTTADPPLLLVLDDTGLADSDWVRIGDGSGAEYRQVLSATAPETVSIPLHFPLSRAHVGATVEESTGAVEATFRIVADPVTGTAAHAQTLLISGDADDIAALVAAASAPLLEIGAAPFGELRFATEAVPVAPTQARVRLDSALLLTYPHNAPVEQLTLTAVPGSAPISLVPDASAGDSVLYVGSRGTGFSDRTHFAEIEPGGDATEVRRLGGFGSVSLVPPLADDCPANSVVDRVALGDAEATRLNEPGGAAVGHMTVDVVSAERLSIGQRLVLATDAARREEVAVAGIAGQTVTLRTALARIKNNDDPVFPLHTLTASAPAGARFLALDSRIGLVAGDVLRVGQGSVEEYVTIAGFGAPPPSGARPDAGTVLIRPALAYAHPADTDYAVRQTPPVPDAATSASALALAAPAGSDRLIVTDGAGLGLGSPGAAVRVHRPDGEVSYHRLAVLTSLATALVALDRVLLRNHPAGATVVERNSVAVVTALDPGAWGDLLRVAIEDEPAGLAADTGFESVTNAGLAHLRSVTGIEPGTVLEVFDRASGRRIDKPVKVTGVDRRTGEVRFASGDALSPGQIGATGAGIRSLEFSLAVYLLRRPDPANPARSASVAASETFRHLSMDPRHSRYFQSVIGDAAGPLRRIDRRPEGESWYIRVRDQAQDLTEPARTQTLEGVRMAPEALRDVLSGNLERPARRALEGGYDAIATLLDAHYLGQDHPDPDLRSGLHALRNIEDISLVACPGRTTAAIQNALITHCELLRYRFAVLDGRRAPADTLADIQHQRQQFDTRYAALYHPWLLVPDPFPAAPATSADYPIAPSGHVLGIYARTDIERGVHKAPANEVVRGVTGLQRLLSKEQQDVLNPAPFNVNVIRDFRNNSRGIRVYGGRVITSDPDWKYVNVRRLLIFIEASIDRGLQWVVFEPNAEPLWARVRRAVSNFLTLVWRNGGLEGTTAEQAFFVKCDRTTMTQTDIDSGRLICLIGVAPVKPAEYVIVRIGLWTAHADE